MNWSALHSFLEVARAGSLARAAAALGVNHSTVLRRLATLEQELGIRLFDRRAGGYAMTPAGEQLRDLLGDVAERIEQARERLSGLDDRPQGVVRLTTTETLAGVVLMPHLAEFRSRFPGIRLEVVVDNAFLNLREREADLAIRPSNSPPEHLLGRRVGKLRFAPYASKACLQARRLGVRNPALADWNILDWIGPGESLAHLAQARWMRQHVDPERVVARFDSLPAMLAATREGLGACMLLTMLGDNDRDLIRLAPAPESLDTQVWVLAHPDLRRLARVRILSDFLVERLKASEHLEPR